MTRNYSGNLSAEKELCIQHISTEPEINNSIKMEVGIEDCLHIEFEVRGREERSGNYASTTSLDDQRRVPYLRHSLDSLRSSHT